MRHTALLYQSAAAEHHSWAMTSSGTDHSDVDGWAGLDSSSTGIVVMAAARVSSQRHDCCKLGNHGNMFGHLFRCSAHLQDKNLQNLHLGLLVR